MNKKSLKILVIGAVGSSEKIIKGLLRHDFNIVGVLGHEPVDTSKVSGWVDLKSLSISENIDYRGFQKINASSHIDWARTKKPDIIFAVGFSQLIDLVWLKMPTLGCIGFHPTCLPKGRGRAPLAWTVLEESCASATFFLMGEGADNGPVFVQEKFEIHYEDDATIVEGSIMSAIDRALDRWLPELKNCTWNPMPQDESAATWFGRRTPEDGLINWNNSAVSIDRLIKASTKPHPGAFTFKELKKVTIWSSQIETHIPIKGVTGRILLTDKSQGSLIQCGIGLLWLKNITDQLNQPIKLKIGEMLGLYPEIEIYKLWQEIERLKK